MIHVIPKGIKSRSIVNMSDPAKGIKPRSAESVDAKAAVQGTPCNARWMPEWVQRWRYEALEKKLIPRARWLLSLWLGEIGGGTSRYRFTGVSKNSIGSYSRWPWKLVHAKPASLERNEQSLLLSRYFSQVLDTGDAPSGRYHNTGMVREQNQTQGSIWQ